MKVLIVDDEPLARRRLSRLLSRISDIVLVGEAENGHEAERRVADLSPDLVLLDIDMPALDGVSLAKRLPKSIAVVFTTAYTQHAVDAFAVAAVDYLLKPIEEARLREAVERVRARRAILPPAAITQTEQPRELRLAARSGHTLTVLNPAHITRLYASDKYVMCIVQGKEHVLDQSLNELEQMLLPHDFLRVHRSELVNLAQVNALSQGDDGAFVELSDGQRAQVSRRSLPELKSRLARTSSR